MTRDEQEMALWREAYNASRLITRAGVEAEADAAVEAFRLRYPPQPSAPEAVRMGRAAIAAMDAIVKVMGDENASNQRKAAQIDRIATRYVTARWHIQRETDK